MLYIIFGSIALLMGIFLIHNNLEQLTLGSNLSKLIMLLLAIFFYTQIDRLDSLGLFNPLNTFYTQYIPIIIFVALLIFYGYRAKKNFKEEVVTIIKNSRVITFIVFLILLSRFLFGMITL